MRLSTLTLAFCVQDSWLIYTCTCDLPLCILGGWGAEDKEKGGDDCATMCFPANTSGQNLCRSWRFWCPYLRDEGEKQVGWPCSHLVRGGMPSWEEATCRLIPVNNSRNKTLTEQVKIWSMSWYWEAALTQKLDHGTRYVFLQLLPKTLPHFPPWATPAGTPTLAYTISAQGWRSCHF